MIYFLKLPLWSLTNLTNVVLPQRRGISVTAVGCQRKSPCQHDYFSSTNYKVVALGKITSSAFAYGFI
jgi:hypothetical protein